MVALVSPAFAARDALLAAGLGFALGLCYRVLRLLARATIACGVCDVLMFALGAVLYRAAATGLFSSGVMRWYTAGALLLAYWAVQASFFSFFFRIGRFLQVVVQKPFSLLRRYILCPAGKKWRDWRAKKAACAAKKKKNGLETGKKDLPSMQRVLYNSNE